MLAAPAARSQNIFSEIRDIFTGDKEATAPRDDARLGKTAGKARPDSDNDDIYELDLAQNTRRSYDNINITSPNSLPTARGTSS